MASLLPITVLLFLLCGSTHCQQVKCSSLSTCSQCLTVPYCFWCSSFASAACFLRDINHTNCNNASHIVDPEAVVTVNTLPLDEDHQVSVSSVQMKLRVGEPQSFNLSVKYAKNFPLDLYILMDLSASFQSDLVTVKTIPSEIFSAVANLTSRFQVGFGTFVDKTTAPFSSPLALRLAYNWPAGPSACSGMPCSRPVSYEHVVNLTNSTDLFSESVQDLLISTSSDDAEGTLDAMMQAVVCTDVVGWREEARKVLLVMTDDLMHTAGDGRLAGIYKPNDARCHTQYDPTENKTLYLASLEYDYPTVEQVRMVMEQFGVVPVFATSDLEKYFTNVIAPMLGGLADQLSTNSDNIVDVITSAHQQIVSQVAIKFDEQDSITISILPICPNATEDKCVNVSDTQTVQFNITVTLISCTEMMKNAGQVETLRGYIPGFGQFLIAVEGICSCNLERVTDTDSSTCSHNGDLTCGQCNCSHGGSGNHPDDSCSANSCPKGPNGRQCSGRGSCVCGQCVCHQSNSTYPGVKKPTIFGNACECDNFLCDKGVDGTVCSGQGTCECANGEYHCSCFNSTVTGRQHKGAACQCNYDNCIDPADPCHDSQSQSCSICNKLGSCDPCSPTRSCRCNSDLILTSYCKPISLPVLAVCTAVPECVICFARLEKEQLDRASLFCPHPSCSHYMATVITSELPSDDYQIPDSFNNTTSICSEVRDDQCTYVYYTARGINGSTLIAVLPPTCLLLPLWAISVVVAVVIIIIGTLLLFAFKLLLVWIDYREEKGQKQLKKGRILPVIKQNSVFPSEASRIEWTLTYV